jgi:hypothetical protein
VLFGRATTADREKAIPNADGVELESWATEQARSIPSQLCDELPNAVAEIASVVYLCGGDLLHLPFCYSSQGWMNLADLRDWIGDKTEVFLAEPSLIEEAFRFVDDVNFKPNVLLAGGNTDLGWIGGGAVWPAAPREQTDHRWWYRYQRTLQGLVVNTLATVWGVSVDDVLRASELSVHPSDAGAEHRFIFRDVGHSEVATISEPVEVIRRPARPPMSNRKGRL